MSWSSICELDDILPGTGACAALNGRQIAVFRHADCVYALDNYDPAGEANVLSRGLVGDIKGERVVASPLYKHHYSLVTGRCLEDDDKSVSVYPARIMDGRIWVNTVPQPHAKPVKRKLIVIGNGMAGMRMVEELLQLAPEAYDVTVFGAEPQVNYNRILLSPVLAGEKRFEEIILHSLQWYADHGVKLHAGDPAVQIDRRRRIVRSRNGVELSYDRLVIATGSKPIVLPVPGADLPGVVTFRDLADVDTMLAAARSFRKAVVIGGGLLGLEAANALMLRGMAVTVVHLGAHLMNRQLDESAASLLRLSLESRGLTFRMSTRTTAILGAQRVTAVRFDHNEQMDADLVVMAAGVRPDIELAKQAGLRCERGVLVDDTMQTYDPSVYAVGECVQHRNNTFGLVAPLWEQARVCAVHLAEMGMSRYRTVPTATQLKVTGIDLYSAGDFSGSEGVEILVMRDHRRGVYKRLVIRDNKLRGAVLYGDASDGAWYFDLMNAGKDITELREHLLFGPALAGEAVR